MFGLRVATAGGGIQKNRSQSEMEIGDGDWLGLYFTLAARSVSAILHRAMKHRNLTHEMYTATAIDDVIERGGRPDWAALRDAAEADPAILRKIFRVCEAHVTDPHAQRHCLWMHYVTRRIA